MPPFLLIKNKTSHLGIITEIYNTIKNYRNAEKHGAYTPNVFSSSDLERTWQPVFGTNLYDIPANVNYYRSFARACINRKATNLAKSEIFLYRQYKSKKTEIKDHPFINLINSQNSFGQSFMEMLYICEANLSLYGEAYLKINSVQTGMITLGNSGKTPVELYPLSSKYVEPVFNSQGNAVLFYRYGNEKILPEDVIRFKIPDPDNNLKSSAPCKSFNFTLDIDYLMSRSRRAFFKNNARPTLAIQMQGDLEEDASEDKKDKDEANYSGVDNDGRIIYATNGATVTALNTNARELDWNTSRERILDEIMLILDVNAQVMGIFKDSNYNNSINAQRGWISQVLSPYAAMVFNEPLKAFVRKYYDPKIITVMEHNAEYDPQTQLERLKFYSQDGIVKKSKIAEMEGFSEEDVPESSKEITTNNPKENELK
jgi:HK97 family phage portal protein